MDLPNVTHFTPRKKKIKGKNIHVVIHSLKKGYCSMQKQVMSRVRIEILFNE